MKKLAFLFVCLFALSLNVSAGNDKPIQVTEMPKAARQFIKNHFANQSIAMAKVETEFMDKNYDVDLSNVIFICTSNEPSPEAIRKKIGDPLYYRVNRYIEFQSLDLAAKKKMVSKIVYEEYMSLRPEEKAKISLANLEERYLRGVEAFQNFRHARNMIRNDINQVLVEDFLIQSNESEEIVSKSKGV